MKNIKSFNDFSLDKTNEEIDLKKLGKNIVTGAAIGAATLSPKKTIASDSNVDNPLNNIETSVQNKDKEDDKVFNIGGKKTKAHTSVKTGNEEARKKKASDLVKRGWTLDSTSVDTLFREIQMQAPETIVTEHNFKFDVEGDKFLTGEFKLDRSVIEGIENVISKVISENGVITDFQIESSTDKEPIDMVYENMNGNEALAHRRADAVEDELIKLGVDSSIISIITKYDNGPDIFKDGMTKLERIEARKESSEYRYVTISIIYLTKDVVYKPAIIEKIPKVKTIYYLSKESKPVRKFGRIKVKNRKVKAPIKNTKRIKGRTECETFGNKSAWWYNL